MALTLLQKDILASISANRSETSYIAGGVVLNKDWPRLSDDIDIFHDTDEEIGAAADLDIGKLQSDGLGVNVIVRIYGCVEAEVTNASEATLIQWMSESRIRFFPLVRDSEWGARLHLADLAVNKVLAASTRTKARDFVDLIQIEANYCRLGPLLMAASGKPPNYSPVRLADEIRRRGLSIPKEDYESVRGLPTEMSAGVIRDKLVAALDRAEEYVRTAPVEIVGLLAVGSKGVPQEVSETTSERLQFRKATSEPELMPSLPEVTTNWTGDL